MKCPLVGIDPEMEASRDHPTPYPGRVRQKYSIRSSFKEKEERPSNEISIIPRRREKHLLSVSKSVSTLDLSVKDKPVKTSRRLSVPSKYATPVSKPENKPLSSAPSSTISESKSTPRPSFLLGGSAFEPKGKPIAKTLSVSFQGSSTKSQTRANAVSIPTVGMAATESSKSGQRRKFSTLMSSSYWLAQIKLAESAGKHAISLGFFRLALESTAEPLQRVRDELKSYAKRHNLLDLGDVAKEVLLNYGVLEEVTAEVETNVGPKELITATHEVCSIIPENDAEEGSNGGFDGKFSTKKSKDESPSEDHFAHTGEAGKPSLNQNSCSEKINSVAAEKSEALASPIEKNNVDQKRKQTSTLKSQTSVVRKSVYVKSTDKVSGTNANRGTVRRRSTISGTARNEQQEEGRGAKQKDKKGSTTNKSSQIDLLASTDNVTEEDKENLDFQQMDLESIEREGSENYNGKNPAINEGKNPAISEAGED